MVDYNIRCPTGIPGFDELIEGGFPRNRSILLSGTCGSGKTTFAVQFLYNGIVKYNEPGILVSLEQDPKELKADMKVYGFDLQKAEDEGKLAIIDASLARVGVSMESIFMPITAKEDTGGSVSLLSYELNIDTILEKVVSKAKKMGAKRAVLDSLPALDFLLTGEGNELKLRQTIRQVLLSFNYKLKASGLTTILITEIPESGSTSSAHGVESYVVDGAIEMYYTAMGMQSGRNLVIKKMRGTEHSQNVHPLVFKKGVGIEVLKTPELKL